MDPYSFNNDSSHDNDDDDVLFLLTTCFYADSRNNGAREANKLALWFEPTENTFITIRN